MMTVKDLCDVCEHADVCWINLKALGIAKAIKEACNEELPHVNIKLGIIECLKHKEVPND